MKLRLVALAVSLSSVAAAKRAPVTPPTLQVRPHEAPIVAPMPARLPTPTTPPPLPEEIAKTGKQIAGAYKCKGNAMTPTGQSVPVEAALVIKLDLDNAWIVSSWSSKASKRADYRTYDGVAHLWTRIQVSNDGSHGAFTSAGEKAGEWLYEGPQSGQSGTIQERHHEQWTGPKEVKLWGEQQLGGTWQKMYEVSCKR